MSRTETMHLHLSARYYVVGLGSGGQLIYFTNSLIVSCHAKQTNPHSNLLRGGTSYSHFGRFFLSRRFRRSTNFECICSKPNVDILARNLRFHQLVSLLLFLSDLPRLYGFLPCLEPLTQLIHLRGADYILSELSVLFQLPLEWFCGFYLTFLYDSLREGGAKGWVLIRCRFCFPLFSYRK